MADGDRVAVVGTVGGQLYLKMHGYDWPVMEKDEPAPQKHSRLYGEFYGCRADGGRVKEVIMSLSLKGESSKSLSMYS